MRSLENWPKKEDESEFWGGRNDYSTAWHTVEEILHQLIGS